jgi:hypothetical protein
MSSTERKSVTLGMPHGTAQHRLRKIVLFDVLRRHKENVCIRCSLLIEKVEDLSIEHVKPWEGISAELFWDLQNIAFSHISCNVPHKYRGGIGKRKIGPGGTTWCSVHREFESDYNFAKNSNHWNGLQRHCREGRPDR